MPCLSHGLGNAVFYRQFRIRSLHAKFAAKIRNRSILTNCAITHRQAGHDILNATITRAFEFLNNLATRYNLICRHIAIGADRNKGNLAVECMAILACLRIVDFDDRVIREILCITEFCTEVIIPRGLIRCMNRSLLDFHIVIAELDFLYGPHIDRGTHFLRAFVVAGSHIVHDFSCAETIRYRYRSEFIVLRIRDLPSIAIVMAANTAHGHGLARFVGQHHISIHRILKRLPTMHGHGLVCIHREFTRKATQFAHITFAVIELFKRFGTCCSSDHRCHLGCGHICWRSELELFTITAFGHKRFLRFGIFAIGHTRIRWRNSCRLFVSINIRVTHRLRTSFAGFIQITRRVGCTLNTINRPSRHRRCTRRTIARYSIRDAGNMAQLRTAIRIFSGHNARKLTIGGFAQPFQTLIFSQTHCVADIILNSRIVQGGITQLGDSLGSLCCILSIKCLMEIRNSLVTPCHLFFADAVFHISSNILCGLDKTRSELSGNCILARIKNFILNLSSIRPRFCAILFLCNGRRCNTATSTIRIACTRIDFLISVRCNRIIRSIALGFCTLLPAEESILSKFCSFFTGLPDSLTQTLAEICDLTQREQIREHTAGQPYIRGSNRIENIVQLLCDLDRSISNHNQ